MTRRAIGWVGLAALALGPACAADFQVGGGDAAETTGTGTDAGTNDDAGSCQVNCDQKLEVCEVDQCSCRSGLTRCGDTCTDLDSDPAHCGSCDVDCGADVCERGNCQPGDCQEEESTNCGGACVDTEQNPLHCNGCDRPCDANELCISADCREFGPGDCESDDDCEGGRKCCPDEENESMICIEGDECP